MIIIIKHKTKFYISPIHDWPTNNHWFDNYVDLFPNWQKLPRAHFCPIQTITFVQHAPFRAHPRISWLRSWSTTSPKTISLLIIICALKWTMRFVLSSLSGLSVLNQELRADHDHFDVYQGQTVHWGRQRPGAVHCHLGPEQEWRSTGQFELFEISKKLKLTKVDDYGLKIRAQSGPVKYRLVVRDVPASYARDDVQQMFTNCEIKMLRYQNLRLYWFCSKILKWYNRNHYDEHVL